MAIFFTKLYESLLVDRKSALQYVENTIRKVAFHNTPQHKRFTESIKNNAEGIVYLGMGNKLPQPQLASEETIAIEMHSWNEDLKKQYDSKTECFLKTTKKGLSKSALAKNEKVELERFTYLEMPFKWIPKHTTVFYRRTNMAECCLIILGHIFRPVDVRQESGSQELIYYEVPTPPLKAYLQSKSAGTAIAKNLAQGLLGGAVYSQVGALIFNEIFPPGTPSYFTEVYKQIEKIVHQELTSQTIDEINAQINSTKDWVAITYTNAKESGTMTKQQLTDLIQPREPELAIELVGVLMDDRYASAGICVFMIGAGMHMAVLQELAFVDPNVSSPNDSSYAKSVQDYAKSYADHAKSTTASIIQQRLDMVKPKSYNYYDSGINYYEYWFVDDMTGYKSYDYLEYCDSKGCHDTDASDKRNKEMKAYKDDVESQLVKDMEDPVATANEWLKLVDQPLPPV